MRKYKNYEQDKAHNKTKHCSRNYILLGESCEKIDNLFDSQLKTNLS